MVKPCVCGIIHCIFIMRAWKFTGQAASPFGEVAFWIYQLRPDGARMVLIRDIVPALRMQQKGFQDRAKAANAELMRDDSTESRRVLESLDLVQQGAIIYCMKLSHIIKMHPETADHVKILPLLSVASKSRPEPTPQLGGTAWPHLPEDDFGESGLNSLATVAAGITTAAPGFPDLGPSMDIPPPWQASVHSPPHPPPHASLQLVPRLLKAKSGRPPGQTGRITAAEGKKRQRMASSDDELCTAQTEGPQHEGIFLGSPTPSMLYGAGLLVGGSNLHATPASTNIHIHLPATPPSFSDPNMLPPSFPTSLPVTRLSEADKKAKYGLGNKQPAVVREQIKDFVRWSTDAVQLSRHGAYSAAVQFSTTDKHETAVLAYLGYLKNVRTDISEEFIVLNAYSSPVWLAGFVSYLMARNVGRGHIIKHIALAKKVNNWLVSGGRTA